MNNEQQKVWDALNFTEEEKYYMACDEASRHPEWSALDGIEYICSKSSYVSRDKLIAIDNMYVELINE